MGSDPERALSGPEREYIKETYDVMLGTFKDYAEMIIQVQLQDSTTVLYKKYACFAWMGQALFSLAHHYWMCDF